MPGSNFPHSTIRNRHLTNLRYCRRPGFTRVLGLQKLLFGFILDSCRSLTYNNSYWGSLNLHDSAAGGLARPQAFGSGKSTGCVHAPPNTTKTVKSGSWEAHGMIPAVGMTARSTTSGFLPSIKCSSCNVEIEISMMGDHVCRQGTRLEPPAFFTPNSRFPASIQPQSRFDRFNNPLASMDAPAKKGQPPAKSGRMPPPRIDASGASMC